MSDSQVWELETLDSLSLFITPQFCLKLPFSFTKTLHMWSLNWHLLSVNAACSWLEKLRLLQLHRTNGLITSIHDPAIIWVVFQRLHLKMFCPSLIEGRIRPFHISSCLNKHKEAKNIFFLVFEKPSQLRKPTQLCVKKREKSHVDILSLSPTPCGSHLNASLCCYLLVCGLPVHLLDFC